MFKKTIAALAVAGAFGTMAAGAVYAADVTLYGVVDLGLKCILTSTPTRAASMPLTSLK